MISSTPLLCCYSIKIFLSKSLNWVIVLYVTPSFNLGCLHTSKLRKTSFWNIRVWHCFQNDWLNNLLFCCELNFLYIFLFYSFTSFILFAYLFIFKIDLIKPLPLIKNEIIIIVISPIGASVKDTTKAFVDANDAIVALSIVTERKTKIIRKNLLLIWIFLVVNIIILCLRCFLRHFMLTCHRYCTLNWNKIVKCLAIDSQFLVKNSK